MPKLSRLPPIYSKLSRTWDACVQLQDEVFRVFLFPAVPTVDPGLPARMSQSETNTSKEFSSLSGRADIRFAPFAFHNILK